MKLQQNGVWLTNSWGLFDLIVDAMRTGRRCLFVSRLATLFSALVVDQVAELRRTIDDEDALGAQTAR